MIDRIGKIKFIQNFMEKAKDKKFYENLNHTLPIIESAYTTVAYVGATQFNNKIPKERKKPLIWQSLIGGVVGLIASKKLDDFTKKHNQKLCVELEKLNLPKGKNIVQGARVLMPLIVTTLIMRYAVSVLSVPLSTKITERQNKLNKMC
jgi:uncharacterized membrane protein